MNDTKEIEILYMDENLVAVNKPPGLLVHAYKKETNERIHLLRLLKEQTGRYLYPVHRLDRPVSGIVIFGLNSQIVSDIKSIWRNDDTVKEYLALVKGDVSEPGIHSFPLLNEEKQKQEAVTHFEPVQRFGNATLLRVFLKTGRKHQIRRHLSRRCANIIGDTKYGQGKINKQFKDQFDLNRIFLHAHLLSFQPPGYPNRLEIRCDLPDDLQAVLIKLKDVVRSDSL